MKPSTAHVLDVLRQGPQTTHDLLTAGCGSRFGARICELRNEFGCVIAEKPVPRPTRGSLYTLVSEGPGVGQASSEAKGPTKREQAAPGPVASTEAARAAAPAEPSGLFDAAVYEPERHSYKDAAA